MKLKALFIYNAVITFPFGICLVLLPALILSIYGIELGEGGAFAARLLGSALIFVALLCWFARNQDKGQDNSKHANACCTKSHD